MADRRKPPEDSGGGGSWMDTYGDLVTLLLTFFVLLFSFSSIDAKKWEEVVQSFTGREPMMVIQPLNPGTGDISLDLLELPTPQPDKTPNPDDPSLEGVGGLNELYRKVSEYITINELEGELTVEVVDEKRIVVRFADSALYDSGSADIKPDSFGTLQIVVEMINQYDDAIKEISIEGHTDTDPIHNARFTDNEDLSMQRAHSVWKYVQTNSNLDRSKVGGTGYGEYRPVAPNDTAENKARNRRVDFVIEGYMAMSENEDGTVG